MTYESVLTVGFPTFNRRESIAARIRELLSVTLPEGIRVLVVDNHSSDGTWDVLLELKELHPEISISRNGSNLGYAGNFIRLFEQSFSRFLMVVSDEDSVATSELQAYSQFLEESDAALVSPRAVLFGDSRGHGRCEKIRPEEFRLATNYISGCTFRVDYAMKFLPKIESKIHSNEAASLYPQVLLSGELLVKHSGVWYPRVLTFKAEQLDTQISGCNGGAYAGIVSRCRQTIDFLEYFNGVRECLDGPSIQYDLAERIESTIRGEFFRVFRLSLRAEHPELARSFESEARKHYRWSSKLMNLVSAALKDPRKAVLAIRKKFLQRKGWARRSEVTPIRGVEHHAEIGEDC